DVRVYSREVSERTTLLAAGAEIFASAADAVAGAELVCLCVFDQDQAREAMLGADAVLAHIEQGTILAIHSTCSSSTVIEIAEAAGPAIRVLDAPFSGSEPGELTLLVGGEDAAFEKARSVFSENARDMFLVGGLGAGQRTKLVNQ